MANILIFGSSMKRVTSPRMNPGCTAFTVTLVPEFTKYRYICQEHPDTNNSLAEQAHVEFATDSHYFSFL